MWRIGLLFALIFLASFILRAQIKNFYSVTDNHEFDNIKFSLNVTNGQCFIEQSKEVSIMGIHYNSDGAVEPQYEKKIINRTKEVNVKLADEYNSLKASISQRIFSSRSDDDYTWKVYLSKLKPMDLDLNYAFGDAYIDLSDLSIERLKMRTGNANIKVNYKKGFGNQMEMDTFMIKVDMGTFEAKNLHLSRSGIIIADVGFGKVQMDFGDAVFIKTDVKVTVGAGKLEIILPYSNIPVKININDSPLCHIKIPKGFQETSENVFVTTNFNENQTNFINFNVDVAVGSIIFKTARRGIVSY